jgi:dihydroflavonol-4-reductase
MYVAGAATEVVGIADAATALTLAAERGRVGERYIVSERFMSSREIYEIAAETGGVEPPKRKIPLGVMYLLGGVGDLMARLRGRDQLLTRTSVRLMHIMSPMDHGKAARELGWSPAPAPDAIRAAAKFFAG